MWSDKLVIFGIGSCKRVRGVRPRPQFAWRKGCYAGVMRRVAKSICRNPSLLLGACSRAPELQRKFAAKAASCRT
eukprot:4872157-Prymnesium_polylepis.1